MAVSLSSIQLEKPFHNKEQASVYSDRGQLLLDKINKGEIITTTDDSNAVIDKEASKEAIEILQSKEYSKFNGGKKLFISRDGKSYSLSNFIKTEEFGSGSGKGAGSANTDIQESAQCYVNALCYKLQKSISSEDITFDNINSVSENVETTSDPTSVFEFVTSDDSWLNSFIGTANIFYNQYPSNKFKFHKGSGLVGGIYTAFKIAKKNEKVSLHNDKWNPADIWAVKDGFGTKEFPTRLDELNQMILELNLNEELIGISLKKLGKEAKLTKVNDGNAEPKEYKFKEAIATPKSANVVIKVNDEKIVFRTFNFASDFAGEILGTNASHGKIGAGAINDALMKFNESGLDNSRDVLARFRDTDVDLINDFYRYYNDIVESVDFEKFQEIISTKDNNWLVSKFMSCKVVFIIKYSKNQNKILEYIMNYSSSTTSNSSTYVKIYEASKGVKLRKLSTALTNAPKISLMMKEHISSGKSLIDNKFKKGSKSYLSLFKEARELYSRGIINILDPKDVNLIKNTKIGEIKKYNGKDVPLDFPITEGVNSYIYTIDPLDRSVNKVNIMESYDERLFQVECHIVLDKKGADIGDTLSDIRAIEGVTIVHINDVDEHWSIENQHSIKIKIKIDPSPFQSVDKSIFNKILNAIKSLPGILKATYISKVKVI